MDEATPRSGTDSSGSSSPYHSDGEVICCLTHSDDSDVSNSSLHDEERKTTGKVDSPHLSEEEKENITHILKRKSPSAFLVHSRHEAHILKEADVLSNVSFAVTDKYSVIYVVESLLEDLKKSKVTSVGKICDICIFTLGSPTLVFTLVGDGKDVEDDNIHYNTVLARKITSLVRKKAMDTFTVVSGVVSDETFCSSSQFQSFIKKQIEEAASLTSSSSPALEEDDWSAVVSCFMERMLSCKAESEVSAIPICSEVTQQERQIEDSLMECPICTEQFDDTSRIPRRMPCCIQSICHSCLEIYTRGRQTISCPICRHQHNLTGGVKSLPREDFILKTLDQVKLRKGLPVSCTDCPDKHAAMAQCDNCGIFLCTQCLNAHVRNNVTKNHKTLTFEEMKGYPIEKFPRLHQCTEHQHPLQFFCHTCQKNICVSCTVVDHDKGQGHNVVSLTEAHKHKTTDINNVLAKLDEKAQKLNQSVQTLQEKKKNINTSKKRAKLDISQTFDDLIEELQRRKSMLLSDVDKESEEVLKMTEGAFDSTNTLLTKVRSSTEYTRQMQSRADKIEDLQLMASSSDTLKTLLQESPQDVQFERAGVYFLPAHVTQLSSTIKGTGLVREVKYSAITKLSGWEDLDFYDSILINPSELPEVSCLEKEIKWDTTITCPKLELDRSTAGRDVTVTRSVITNTAKVPAPPDSGCRMQRDRVVLVSRPLMIRRGQRIMYTMKVNFVVKRQIKDKRNVFESALTTCPVDSNMSQTTGLSVQVVSCRYHDQKLCLWIVYGNNLLTDVPIIKKIAPGLTHELHLCFVLDGDNNKIHVIDADAVKLITSVSDVVFDRPLWILMRLSRIQSSDMKAELLSGNQLNVSDNMKQILSSCR